MRATYSRGNTLYPWLTSLFGFGSLIKPLYLFSTLCGLKSEMQPLPPQHIQSDLALGHHFIENGLESEVLQIGQGVFDLIEVDKFNFVQSAPPNR